jgi:general stress protein 26
VLGGQDPPPSVEDMSEHADQQGDREHLVGLMGDMPIAMFTTFGSEGPRTVPMARQEVEPDAEMWFITARDTAHTRALQTEPQVALSFSSRDAWVALTGTAALVEDRAKLDELWNTFAEAWLPGGPDNPEAVLIRVDVDRAEYWDTPGGKVASLISFAKTRLTGDTYDADHGVVEP